VNHVLKEWKEEATNREKYYTVYNCGKLFMFFKLIINKLITP